MKKIIVVIGIIFSFSSMQAMDRLKVKKLKNSSGQASQDDSQSMGTPGRDNKAVHSPGRNGSGKKPAAPLTNSSGVPKTRIDSKEGLRDHIVSKKMAQTGDASSSHK